jgi:hypothetical protein
MAPIATTMALASALFVPLFIIALVMLKSARRAFVLAGTFSIGAVAAGLLSLAVAMSLSLRRHSDDVNGILVMLFAAAGAVAGGVLAVLLLGKLAKYPPWRRY